MSLTSETFFFAVMALFLFVGSWLSRQVSFYRDLPELNNPGRLQSLDGLRGLLALSVFVHHGVITFFYYKRGFFSTPPSQFYTLIGQVSVLFFFTITGFLFWGKAITSKGRVNPGRLFFNRVRRIVPLYTVSVFAVILVAGYVRNFNTQGEGEDVVGDLAKMLSMGFINWTMLFGMKASVINSNVHWTLQYEWIFYAALPLLALVLMNRSVLKAAVFLALVATVANAISTPEVVIWPYFFVGMVMAHLAAHRKTQLPSRSPLLLAVVLVPLVVIFLIPIHAAVNWPVLPLLAISFTPLALGFDCYGFLAGRGMRCLGTLSYSIYLLHGILLYVSAYILHRLYPIPSMSAWQWWAYMAAMGVLLVMICSLTYRFIEFPFLRSSKPASKTDSAVAVSQPASA